MLSNAKHLRSLIQISIEIAAEVLRSAQDDNYLHRFS